MSLGQELNLDIPFKDIRHEAVLNVVHTATVIGAAGTALFRQFDLTQAQFNALFSLKHKNVKLTQSDLGKRLVVTRASITSILDKLEGKGLVKRHTVPGNRRSYHVELTDAGRTLIDEVEPLYRDCLAEATRDLSDADCTRLIGLLEQVRARTRKIREPEKRHRQKSD
ncbi:MAG: MarR family transcriptional regulator [bacterium]|nr:MarR family transcriptional regulator [bacterium]